MEAPLIKVGILSSPEIKFLFHAPYLVKGGKYVLTGNWTARTNGKRLLLTNGNEKIIFNNGVEFVPQNESMGTFTLHSVTIGVDFHWQRFESQRFSGGLKLLLERDSIIGINILSIEDYLISVISSEMSATSSVEMLKAHAVISRSWLLAQIQKSKTIQGQQYQSLFEDDQSRIRWYDREDHANFDVCGDDHCQRYQGITRASTEAVRQAVNQTRGELLMYNQCICDARFSKCCGGATELFQNCWEPVNHPYLQKVVDAPSISADYGLDLTNETVAREWILGSPVSFCNTNDKAVLNQVLNDYDQETNDFYRWKVVYQQDQLSELIRQKTGIDFGVIESLEPIERGTSGRLIRLRINGSKRSMILGKELEIRKALSESHLYSSAFVVDKTEENGNVSFVIHGAGWGHGVGLCQIGAAMMGAKGYSYQNILMHYFRGATLEKCY